MYQNKTIVVMHTMREKWFHGNASALCLVFPDGRGRPISHCPGSVAVETDQTVCELTYFFLVIAFLKVGGLLLLLVDEK